MKKGALGKFLRGLALAAVLAGVAAGTQQFLAMRARLQQMEAAAPAADPSLNQLARAAVAQGLPECAALINQITQPMIKDSKVGVNISKVAPGFLSYAIEVDLPQSGVYYVSLNAANASAGSGKPACAAEVESTTHWANDCDSVHKAVYADAVSIKRISESVSVLSFGPKKPKILMIPVPDACIVIKRQSFAFP
jgi:hypothetical protein